MISVWHTALLFDAVYTDQKQPYLRQFCWVFLNKLILYYPFKDVVINNEMIQIYSIKVKVGCNHCRLAEKKK